MSRRGQGECNNNNNIIIIAVILRPCSRRYYYRADAGDEFFFFFSTPGETVTIVIDLTRRRRRLGEAADESPSGDITRAQPKPERKSQARKGDPFLIQIRHRILDNMHRTIIGNARPNDAV